MPFDDIVVYQQNQCSAILLLLAFHGIIEGNGCANPSSNSEDDHTHIQADSKGGYTL